ncbi:MAG: hypothetical protein A3K60_01690 [Euryarchaeota archaeon RBG_19FT_COMBO_56_21]|nr:MAG: hypothetical protein A3K60_01690 [Euryarchaeota archaeon RBG_19FT_COMBO_56_21]
MIELISRDLLMILARRGRIEVIRTLKSFPDRDFTINELARTAKVPAMTTWRAVKELKKLGVVRTRKIGNSTSVTITEDRERLRTLRMVPDTDPQRAAARQYAQALGKEPWMTEARLFGSIGRGEHAPGDEVDIAIIFDDALVSEQDAKARAADAAQAVKNETNVTIVPLCVALKDMSRKGGLAAELRDKESIWSR